MKLLVKKKQFLIYCLTIINATVWLVLSIDMTPKQFNAVIALSFVSAFLLGGAFIWFNELVQEAKKNNKV